VSATVAAPIKKKPGEFRCYRCRGSFTRIEGLWVKWDYIQVHLCITCEQATRASPERKDR
jgi:hypothetical protein